MRGQNVRLVVHGAADLAASLHCATLAEVPSKGREKERTIFDPA